MKPNLVLIFVMLVAITASGQKRNGLPGGRNSGTNELVFAIGIAAGQETFIGLPKVGVYKEFPFANGKAKARRFGFRRNSFYAGGEVSLFVLFAGAYSADVNCGFALGPFTIDNSLTGAIVIDPEGETAGKYVTYNPKIGLMIGPVWLKAGPSYALAGGAVWENRMKVNGTAMNVELLFVVRNGY